MFLGLGNRHNPIRIRVHELNLGGGLADHDHFLSPHGIRNRRRLLQGFRIDRGILPCGKTLQVRFIPANAADAHRSTLIQEEVTRLIPGKTHQIGDAVELPAVLHADVRGGLFELPAVLLLEPPGDRLGNALIAEEEIKAFALDLVIGDVHAAFVLLRVLDEGIDLRFEGFELFWGEDALVRADLQNRLVVAARLTRADITGDILESNGERMLFDDGLTTHSTRDGDEAGEHPVLLLAVGLEPGVPKLRVDGERGLQMALKGLMKRLPNPGALELIRITTRTRRDIQNHGSFAEPGTLQVTLQADAVLVYRSFSAAFDAEHSLQLTGLVSLREVYAIDY